MDGIHDLGGMAGFGPIAVEVDEPTFHEPWEGTAFALNALAIGSLHAYNADEYRHAIERMDPIHYLNARYYERVLTGVASLMVEKGVVTRAELEGAARGRFPFAHPNAVVEPDGREAEPCPRFAVGDRVRVRDIHPAGHTRVPRYVRGKQGIAIHVAPRFRFPDASAHGLPPRDEPTVHVEFWARDLWGSDADEHDRVVVDLWETYLEVADGQ